MGTPNVTISRATLDDAVELCDVMRGDDALECEAYGEHPLDTLIEALDRSEVSYSVRFGNEIAAMYGVGPAEDGLLCGRGIAWLLTGKVVNRNPKLFMRLCKALLADLLDLYPRLENAIDARYTRAIRWARKLGFSVGAVQLVGPRLLPFHHVSIGG